MQGWDKRLLGISLDLPSSYLNATKAFTPPKPLAGEKGEKPKHSETSFLWQAPNSQAMLWIGEKWMELHGFVAEVLETPQHGTESAPGLLADKAVSTKYPSWLEHALRLSRARGYFTVYPSRGTASSVAAVHQELFQPPEEYGAKSPPGQPSSQGGGAGRPAASEVRLTSGGFLDTLPEDGTLPPFNNLPLLSWDGELTTLPEMDGAAREYTLDFRRRVGGCDEQQATSLAMDGAAKDLFCSKKTGGSSSKTA